MLGALQAGLERLDIQAEQALCSAYLRYIELLAKWNTAYNLTAVKEPEAMLNRHILDSLSVHSLIEGEHCLDIGTGAGLPGLILALAQPDKHWTLLDSNIKKTRFLQHVKTQLNISNIDIVHSRAENFQNEIREVLQESENPELIEQIAAELNHQFSEYPDLNTYLESDEFLDGFNRGTIDTDEELQSLLFEAFIEKIYREQNGNVCDSGGDIGQDKFLAETLVDAVTTPFDVVASVYMMNVLCHTMHQGHVGMLKTLGTYLAWSLTYNSALFGFRLYGSGF